jgi:hypothetical protein
MVGSDRQCTHNITLGIFLGLCYHLLGFTGKLVRLEFTRISFGIPVALAGYGYGYVLRRYV